MEIKKIATREAYGKTLEIIGEENENIVVLDADLSGSTKTSSFAKKFPERFFNVGVAEQNLAGVAAGISTCGKIPFMSSFAMFATGRAYEQVRNSIAYSGLNVKIAATHSGVTVGEDGGSHQSIEDIALMRGIPGMTVICPADATETEFAVREAVKINGPVYLRLGRQKTPVIFDSNSYSFELGKGIVLEEGEDITIISTGIMTWQAKLAVNRLKEEGYKPELINIHTIKPIDEKLIVDSAKKTKAVVTAEEHSIIGGLGGAVSEVLSEKLPTKIKRVGVNDKFGQSGNAEELMKLYNLTAEDIYNSAIELLKRR